jgi:concanavalin A-like lectin/glucanase superfamily protein
MPRSRIIGNGLGMGMMGGSGQSWSSYVTGLAPLAWWRCRQTSGTNEPNAGSLGSAVDLTITAATLNQAGKLGAGEAYLYDGTATRLSCANNATLAALTSFEMVWLLNPSSAGEGSFGSFFAWGAGTSGTGYAMYYNGGASALRFQMYNTTPSTFGSTTTSAPANATWSLIFAAYDDAGDRKAHLYKGVSGAVSEFAYSSQTAVSGTFKAPTGVYTLGNISSPDQTFAGLFDEAMIFSGNLTPTQRTQLCLLAGV